MFDYVPGGTAEGALALRAVDGVLRGKESLIDLCLHVESSLDDMLRTRTRSHHPKIKWSDEESDNFDCQFDADTIVDLIENIGFRVLTAAMASL
jgi:hypothetical protein